MRWRRRWRRSWCHPVDLPKGPPAARPHPGVGLPGPHLRRRGASAPAAAPRVAGPCPGGRWWSRRVPFHEGGVSVSVSVHARSGFFLCLRHCADQQGCARLIASERGTGRLKIGRSAVRPRPWPPPRPAGTGRRSVGPPGFSSRGCPSGRSRGCTRCRPPSGTPRCRTPAAADGPRVFRTAAWWHLCCLLPVQVLVVDLKWGLVAES